MIPAPISFPTENNHRIAHFFPEQPNEFARVEEILADAIAAAREALEALDALPHGDRKPADLWIREIAKQVEARRLLTDDFRRPAQALLRHLAQIDPTEPQATDTVLRRLRDALNGSVRVSDFLAAEQDIGWHRGISR